jgi:hypothetical protein
MVVQDFCGLIDFSFGTCFCQSLPGVVGTTEANGASLNPDVAFAAPGDSGALVYAGPQAIVQGSVVPGVGLVMARAYAYDPSGHFAGYHVLWSSLVDIRNALSTTALPAPLPAPITFFL